MRELGVAQVVKAALERSIELRRIGNSRGREVRAQQRHRLCVGEAQLGIGAGRRHGADDAGHGDDEHAGGDFEFEQLPEPREGAGPGHHAASFSGGAQGRSRFPPVVITGVERRNDQREFDQQ